MEEKRTNKTIVKEEILRNLPSLIIIAIVVIIMGNAAQLAISAYNWSMVCFSVIIVHFIRKMLQPYADLKQLVQKSAESPLAASIIFNGNFVVAMGENVIEAAN